MDITHNTKNTRNTNNVANTRSNAVVFTFVTLMGFTLACRIIVCAMCRYYQVVYQR